jgi:hypothetical protein
MSQETHEWVQRAGAWEHSEYGPATGECGRCNLAFLEDPWDGGVMAFKIPKQGPAHGPDGPGASNTSEPSSCA